MDLIQILIVISLLVVSVSVAVCTYYIITLIIELKKTIIKTTSILDDTHLITSSVAKPVSSFSDFLMGFKNGFKLFNTFFDKDRK
jgi:hypothetical protein